MAGGVLGPPSSPKHFPQRLDHRPRPLDVAGGERRERRERPIEGVSYKSYSVTLKPIDMYRYYEGISRDGGREFYTRESRSAGVST